MLVTLSGYGPPPRPAACCRAVLAALADSELETPRKTNWWPCQRISTTLIHEQVHRGAEISLLRELYRNGETLGYQDTADSNGDSNSNHQRQAAATGNSA